jgi:murein DD-endopeptidase MepM/ murein hydrolase activator NlpD
MKRYHAYKKQSSLIVLGILFILIPLVFSDAQTGLSSTNPTASSLQSQINQRNADIANLQQQIAQYQSQLDTISKQKDSLAGQISSLNLNEKKLATNIAVTQDKIDNTNLTIQSLSSQIGTKQDNIQSALNSIALYIKQINEFEQGSIVDTVLSDNDFTSAWNDIDTMETVQASIRESITTLREVKGQLEDTKTETVDAKNQLVTLEGNLSDQKKIVDQNTAQKNELLKETKNSEANYQALVQSTLAKKTALEEDIRNYELQLKYILNPGSLPSSGSLSWPLSSIFVTQLFGKTIAGKRLYANGTHNGVDFGASVGTPVMAMGDGVVAGTGDTDIQCPKVSFGRFILIKYNNGLASTFGHLSLIKVSAGETVTRGEVVGYSGSTGYVTGPHLHVSVYARDAVNIQTLPAKSCPGHVLTQPISPINAYLDPLFYLPPITPNMIKKDA